MVSLHILRLRRSGNKSGFRVLNQRPDTLTSSQLIEEDKRLEFRAPEHQSLILFKRPGVQDLAIEACNKVTQNRQILLAPFQRRTMGRRESKSWFATPYYQGILQAKENVELSTFELTLRG